MLVMVMLHSIAKQNSAFNLHPDGFSNCRIFDPIEPKYPIRKGTPLLSIIPCFVCSELPLPVQDWGNSEQIVFCSYSQIFK